MASPSGCRCYQTMSRLHIPTPCLWWSSWLSWYTRVRILVLRREHELFFPLSLTQSYCPFVAPAAPTALAYTVSLMSTSLSRVECKRHLILFSTSTPVGAIASYASFSFFGSKNVDGVGTAL